MSNNSENKSLGKVVQINEAKIQDHLGELVRGTVEETLNAMLDAEADAMCGAQRYERSPDRIDTRAGHYERKFHAKAGEVTLKMPKLRKQTFETAIIERYKRRETSIEEALMEMYLAGVSVRRVEDITEALWGTRVSSGTVSKLNKKVYKHIETWRNRPIRGEYPYVYLDGIVLKRSWAGEVRNVSVLVAVGVDQEGYRHILGVQEGHKEDKSGWGSFLEHLKSRGLKGIRMIISDACMGLSESAAEYFPEADWQRCTVHFYRNVFSHVPRAKMALVSAMLKAIHAQESREAAQDKAMKVVEELRTMRLQKAADLVERCIDETFAFYSYPQTHWLKIRTNNPLERIMREIRRRTRVVGAFPDGESAVMLVGARLRHIASTKWGTRKYMSMDWLRQQDIEAHQSA
ncbi:IS256 family transposase [Kineobactrum salinum]|uniref:Mutator family transposase n=1 Tax=Kineobactrum salinum TaxID=2708301 RepID=A0A6C0U1F3_9GAMM|nr:IS256 family transposase [Kineobactrum salinum]QIB65728.1 IS256 family transposase [Kineobactrum salinum]